MANIKSLFDLGNKKGEDDDHSDEDGGGYNDYYAGGEKSGQLIRGAPKKDDKSKDNVGSLFEQFKQAGAQQGTSDDLQQPSSQGPFLGTGRTLAGGSSSNKPAQDRLVYVITFYNNDVFTVNDGPPRNVYDPANKEFIQAIQKGVCPEELEPEVPGTPITVNLVRKAEDYKEPEKPKMVAFSGTGFTLAGPSGAASSSSAAAGPAPPASAPGEWAGVNESLPTTSLQLRLADGSRMVARFNHSHHISDIRRFIRASRPDITFPYTLMTGVPPQPLSEAEDLTLEAAGLLNSVIIQKK